MAHLRSDIKALGIETSQRKKLLLLVKQIETLEVMTNYPQRNKCFIRNQTGAIVVAYENGKVNLLFWNYITATVITITTQEIIWNIYALIVIVKPILGECHINIGNNLRGVAQLGSARDLGSRGRRFKSCRPDHV